MKNLSNVSGIRGKDISYILFLLENNLIKAVAQGENFLIFTISVDFINDVRDALQNANYIFEIYPAMEKLSESLYLKSSEFIEIKIKLK